MIIIDILVHYCNLGGDGNKVPDYVHSIMLFVHGK